MARILTVEYAPSLLEPTHMYMDPRVMIIGWHRRYSFLDYNQPEQQDLVRSFKTLTDFTRWANKRHALFHALYMLDHSGLVFSLRPFSYCWDSGQLGYVCRVPGAKLRKGETWDKVFAGAVDVLNKMQGPVYDVRLQEHGERHAHFAQVFGENELQTLFKENGYQLEYDERGRPMAVR